METLDRCPICRSRRLTLIGTRTIATTNQPASCFDGGNNVLLEFVLRKKQSSNDTWQCKDCTHIFLSPTFDQEELDRLYSEEAFRLTKLQYRKSEEISGKSWAEQHQIPPEQQETRLNTSLRERPRRLHEILASINVAPQQACDVGGMDGHIMSGLSNCQKFVFDKVNRTEPETCTYLHSLESLAERSPYDLMIFSHVLEHVTQPTDFLKQFIPHLAPKGCFYLEVPLEYQGSYVRRKGIPIGGHVNFFTMPSLKRLATEIGMSEIIFSNKEIAWYGEIKIATLKLVCAIGTENAKPSFYWPLEIAQDIYYKYKSNDHWQKT